MSDFIPLLNDDKKFLLKVARDTLNIFFQTQKFPDFETTSKAVLEKRPAFVTLRKKITNELRGCRGETTARRPLMDSVQRMVVASAIDDPRFDPVTLKEIKDLHIEINALTPMHLVSADEVVVGKHGLMIVKDFYAGLLLPSVPLQYNWDKNTFLDQLCIKAGLPKGTWKTHKIDLYAFESEEWGEDE